MNKKERELFRKSDAWKKFRAKCRLRTSTDFITKRPLAKDWNLHHLNLDTEVYDNINDMEQFLPLNKKTHEIVHELYKWYRKDHAVLERIKTVLQKMEDYTNGNC